ncbi:SafA/ExsA family spore coat assembly protein [Bacillus sp. REN16]|uniref:SafA/ExsA family spore coat assembly protein n=1 Tax=Bacillus sp. REN16 TaxID=2887296 RepID=UPI001E56268F|nr:SafA/ExsA family spore coat assembly protein [Bacillus sp. REN16]MCC3356576.1 SafA/ExsA family spore coat assembly protein [Bacillus sp. REN16]
MKIHIVQKGDTLWEIAKKYGVDFGELKAVNTQLSNPDMLMPGMKIKVPTGTVHVKKEAQIGGAKKEAQIHVAPKKEEQIQHPFANITPQPFPVMEVEEEVPEVKEEVKGVETGPYIPQMPQIFVMPQAPAPPPPMPVMPQMPQYQPLEIDINNYNLMDVGMPQLPTAPQNVLPGMMAPVEDDFGPEEDYEAAMSQMPQSQPMAQMPQMPQMPIQQPAMFNHCVPMTPVMPGSGFNYVPGFQGGFPPQGPFNPMGGSPRTEGVKEQVKEEVAPVQMAPAPAPVPMPQPNPFEIDINNFNIMQAQMPQMVAGVEDEFEDVPEMPQMMPQMAPMQAPPFPMGPGPCVPVSPVMPGMGFNGGFPGMGQGPTPFAPGMPMQAAPQAVSPAMTTNPFGNPGPGYAGPMNQQMMPSQFYNKKDCGCGGPKPPFEGGQFPQQGYPMGQPGFAGQFPQQGFPMGQPGFAGQFPQQNFPMGQPGFPGQFQPQFQGGFPGQQGVPFGMNPNQQMAFNPMFNMPDVDDDLD